jgi:hypothetical protein
MSIVNFSNLDFNQIKTSIRDYLKSNSNFTDYDFEGSNLSLILDILAYNTYITSYNANMVSNEVFIDSATLRDNIVSLAKNIGYVPRSRTSSSANISFFVDVSSLSTNPTQLTLQKGIVCTSSVFGGQSYSFNIQENITVPIVNSIATFNNIEVKEGTYITQTFTVNSQNTDQRFILNNSNIDTHTIRVLIKETQQSTSSVKYNLTKDIIDIDSSSKIFFVQEIEDERYELIFGDGTFGKKLDNLNYIEVSYLITNGPDANGISSFTFNGRIFDNNGSLVTSDISLVTTDTISNSGKEIESVNSIKKYAPRIYSSQNRAVTASDYESIVAQIYPDAEAISVFGGEELSPPRYGKVFISIKPFNGKFVSNPVKDNIKSKLRKYAVAGIVPEIVDIKYLYIEYDATAYYNQNFAIGPDEIKSIIADNIQRYSDSSELNRYGARFKYSKFLKIIDDSHDSVTSNITKITMRRDGKALINQIADYEICFGNQFHIKNMKNGYNIKTSGFTIDGISDVLYFSDIPDSDGRKGKLFLFKLKSPTEPVIIRNNVGSVDYIKGEILISPIKFTSSVKQDGITPIIQFSAIPQSNDVIGVQDLYLQMDINNSILSMKSDDISSGGSISGSTYDPTSSYTNGMYVRL